MKSLACCFIVAAATLSAQVPQYNVTMTPADYNLLYTRDIFSDSVLPSKFEYQGTYWNNTQIRFKGHSTRYYSKKGYRVKFPGSNLFQGLGAINFNAMYTDKSCMREKLAWDLFDDMGTMASSSHYGRLTINNEDKGLFLFIDKPDKYFLINRGRTVGPMFEASDTYAMADFTIQPDSIIKLNYEQSIGTAADYVDLENMIRALNVMPATSFADSLNKYFDVNTIVNWFAGNILTMMGDSYVKSYLLYRDTSRATQQWSVIPWDYDLSFGRNGEPTIPYPADLMNDDFAYSFPPLSGPSTVLKDRFWNTPALRERLRQRLDTLLKTVFSEQKMYPKIDSLAVYIQRDVDNDPYKWGTYNDFLEHVEALKYYVTARRNFLDKTFINTPDGQYNDVTLKPSQLGIPYDFVAYDGRQLATLWLTAFNGLDSIRVEAFPDSMPPDVGNPGSGRYVRRWLRVTPYPVSATFSAKLQWSYDDVAANYREVGSGVQDEHLLRPFVYDGSGWSAASGKVNAFGNFVTIDSINETHCGAGKYFALLMSDTYTQTWFRQPLNNWQRWYDVKFTESQNGLVVGDHGTTLRTTDGGASWNEGTIGFNLAFHSLAIPSLDNILTVGEHGACFHSADSATTWSRTDLGTTKHLRSVEFSSPSIGWIAGDSGALYRTLNGGSSWTKIDSVPAGDLYSAGAVGRDSVIVAGNRGLFMVRTSDAGATWHNDPLYTGIALHKLARLGPASLWAVGDSGRAFYLRQPGMQLEQIDVPSQIALRGIFLLDSTRIYVCGDGGMIFYSQDNGTTWFAQYSADSHDLTAMSFTDSAHGYAVGNGGTILTTNVPGTLTDMKSPAAQLPGDFQLFQNYPNPFNPITEIRFKIADVREVSLKVYDILGREITTLIHESLSPGSYSTRWNADGVASGVYFYRLEAASPNRQPRAIARVGKMLLLK